MENKDLNKNPDGSGGDTHQGQEGLGENNQGQNTAVFDLSETTGGRFKDPDSLKQFFETFENNYKDASQFEGYIPENDAYANSFVKEVNTLLKNGTPKEQVRQFVDLSFMDVNSIDEREAIAQSMALTDGISIKNAKTLVYNDYPTFEDYMRTHGVDADDPDDVDAAKVKYSVIEARLEREAKAAKKVIEDKRKDIFSGVEEAEQRRINEAQSNKALTEKAVKAWSENSELKSAVSEKLSSVSFSYKNEKDGVDYSLSVPIDQKVVDGLYKKAVDFAIQNKADTTKENIEVIVGLLKEDYIVKNLDTIIGSLYEDIRSKVTKELTDKESGRRPDRTGGSGGSGGAQTGMGFFGRK